MSATSDNGLRADYRSGKPWRQYDTGKPCEHAADQVDPTCACCLYKENCDLKDKLSVLQVLACAIADNDLDRRNLMVKARYHGTGKGIY